MNLQGKIYKIFETKQITDTFRKREFVIDYTSNSSYPQYVKMEMIQDNCSKLDGFNIGDNVSIEFDIKGREWQNPKNGEFVYFVTLGAWQINKTGSGNSSSDEIHAADTMPAISSDIPDEDLPF